MLDLSNLKTWTDGLWAVISAPHIVVPLLVIVAVAVWWFRGTFERIRRDGLQSIIGGRDAQIVGLNMQNAVAQERLRLANDLQEYASTRFADAEKEAAKLRQQSGRIQTHLDLMGREIDVMHHAGIVHLAVAIAQANGANVTAPRKI